MTKYFVTVGMFNTLEVEAATQEEAELLAVEMFNPDFAETYVHDSWEAEGEAMLETMIADYEEKEHAAELENFDPITLLEKQEQTGELK